MLWDERVEEWIGSSENGMEEIEKLRVRKWNGGLVVSAQKFFGQKKFQEFLELGTSIEKSWKSNVGRWIRELRYFQKITRPILLEEKRKPRSKAYG